MSLHSLRFSTRAFAASLIASASLALPAIASAQNLFQVYGENFNSGYTAGNTLSDQQSWTTNDEYTGGSYTYNTTQSGFIGQSDFVGYQSNLSTGLNDYVGFLGGGYGQQVAPGVGANTTVTLNHSLPTAGQGTVVFSVDYQVTNPTTASPTHDSFGFALTGGTAVTTATGTTVPSLLSINFVPNSTNSNASDNITYSNAAQIAAGTGASTATGAGMTLGTNARYRLTISVNTVAGTFSATYQAENVTTGALTGSVGRLVTNATYGTGNITGYAETWTLADKAAVAAANNPAGSGANATAHTDFGNNTLYFDNVVVSVPEPSTYAMLGLGALGMMLLVRRARLN